MASDNYRDHKRQFVERQVSLPDVGANVKPNASRESDGLRGLIPDSFELGAHPIKLII